MQNSTLFCMDTWVDMLYYSYRICDLWNFKPAYASIQVRQCINISQAQSIEVKRADQNLDISYM